MSPDPDDKEVYGDGLREDEERRADKGGRKSAGAAEVGKGCGESAEHGWHGCW